MGRVFFAPETLTTDEAAAAAAIFGKTSAGPVSQAKARGGSAGQGGAAAAAHTGAGVAPKESGNKHLSKLAKAVLAGLG